MKKAAFFILVLFFTLKALAQTAPGVTIDPSLTESPMSIKTLAGLISGSFVIPKNAAGKVPIVLIISDAGSTDKDGNNPKAGIAGNTYKLLANDLGLKGIATLRYDKRLVGESASITKESQLHIEDYSDDATVLINMLNDDQRFSKIILFGHGEGALVAMIAQYDQPAVKAYISAEGAADKADKILADQVKSKSLYMVDQFKTIMDSLRKGKTTPNVDPSLYFIARPSVQPFIMSWCRYDPIRIIKKIKIPVLIIQGTTDLTVTTDNGDRLKKTKSEAVLLTVKDMNHILKDAPADKDKNMATYANTDLPLKPEMVTGIVDFINKIKQ
jgi:pimeloyl-ACP methyl ester carboxylesterase